MVQDLFLTDSAKYADVVLPAASFAEKDGTFTNAERRIQRLRAGIKSPGEAKSDFAVFQSLLNKLKKASPATPAAAFDELTAEVAGYAGIHYEQIGSQGQVWGGETLVPVKRVLVPVAGSEPLQAEYQLLVGSALYHSGSISTRSKGPMSVCPESYIELGRDDAATLKVKTGDMIQLKADEGTIRSKVKVDNRLPKGVIFAPYHFADLGLNRIYTGQSVIAVEPSKV